MNAQTDYRKMVENDLLDLAKVFCSLQGYGSPSAMRYSLFIQKDGTVGDESFSYQRADTAPNGIHLRRLRELGLIGLCSVKVQAESSRYYGIHLTISDAQFQLNTSPTVQPSLKDESFHPVAQSYYFPKVLRVMEDEAGHPDFRQVQLISGTSS